MKQTSILTSYIYITISAIIYGFLVFGAGMMGRHGYSLIEILIIPNTIVFVVLFYFVRQNLKSFFAPPLWVNILYPIICIMCQVGQCAPLFFGVSVSLTVFILYTQPIWTILISTIFLKTKFTKNEAITAIAVIIGLVLLLAPWRDLSYSVIGVIIALIGSLGLSSWVIMGAYYSKNNIKPITTSFYTNVYLSIPFILAYPLIAKFLPEPEISAFSFNKSLLSIAIVFLYSVIIYIAAQMFFYEAAKKVNNIHLGLILLLEPVVGTILDVTFLGTSFTWNIALGGALILLANARLIIKTT